MEVTVTLAPTTALPCGSVTVPMMLPKTACPDAAGACSINRQNKPRVQPLRVALPFHPSLRIYCSELPCPNQSFACMALDQAQRWPCHAGFALVVLSETKESCAKTPER